MKDAYLMNTKGISDHFRISRSSISRWVARGCPHKKYGNQLLFCLDEVEKWTEENKDPKIARSICLKSRRSLKRYHVFSVRGDYQGEVFGSKQLINRLNTMEPVDHHHPYGVDENGFIYFIYSGKLRKHESVKGMAGVKIQTRYQLNIQPLMEFVYNKYVGRRLRQNKQLQGVFHSPAPSDLLLKK